jgi:hypothetical protein
VRARQRVVVGALVFVLSCVLYASFLPRLYTADDLQYAATIRTAVTGRPVYHPVGGAPFPAPVQRPDVPVNPRYALDWPTSVAAVRISRDLGWGSEIDAILVIRFILGAAGVTFFFMTVLLIGGRLAVAAFAAAVLATTSVYWTYSTHLDESIGMMAFTCVALYFLVRRIVVGRSRYDLLVPLLLGAASLYNLTAAVTAVPFGLAWTLEGGTRSSRVRFRSLGEFALAFVGVAAIGVIGALLATGSGSDIFRLGFWKSSLFVGRPEYGFRPFHDAFDVGASFLRGLVAYPPVRGLTTLREYFNESSTWRRLAALVYYAAVGLVALAPPALLLRRRPWPDPMRRLVAFGAAWLVSSLLFAWWWDPSYVKYLLLPVVGWCFLAALALTLWLPDAARVGIALTAAAIVTVFVLNLATIFWPQRREGANEWLAAANELRGSSPSALFVSAGRHPLDSYVPYFADRDLVSAGLIRYASGNEAEVARVVEQHVRQHVCAGGPIYVYGLGSVTSAERRSLLRLLPGTSLRPAWTFPGLTIYRRTG